MKSELVTEAISKIEPGLRGFRWFQGRIRNQTYEFEYPDHWIVGDTSLLVPQGGRWLVIHGPWNKGKNYRVELEVIIAPLDVEHPFYTYAEEELDLQIRRVRGFARRIKEAGLPNHVLRNWEILSDGEVEVDGQRAREVVVASVAPIIYEYHPVPEERQYKEDERAIERRVAFQRRTIMYMLTYRGSEEEDQIYVKAYDRLLGSFRVRFSD